MNHNTSLFGLLIAILGLIASIAYPEVRCFLHLENNCSGISSVNNPQPPLPPPVPSQPPAPMVVLPPPPVAPPPPSPSPSPSPLPSLQPRPGTGLVDLVKDEFETLPETMARFNQAVSQLDSHYQAGVAHLEKYDANQQTYTVRCDWQPWAKLLSMPQRLTFSISAADAKALKQAGVDKPLFLKLEAAENYFTKREAVLGGEAGKVWSVTLPPTPELVVIPAGQFRMGDLRGTGNLDEQPVHNVSLDSFAMGRYELTFEEYDYFAEQTGRERPADQDWGRGRRPVINVSWQDATAYVEWLSQWTGQPYCLPTEAQWEYAARGGTETDYWWGNEVGVNRANFDGSGSQWSNQQTAPVGSFAANPFGLYDTVGNVWEWSCSKYTEKYGGEEQRCAGKEEEGNRLLRGGSWGSLAVWCRAACRA